MPLPLLTLIFMAAGALNIAIALPLLRRRIGPNPWYGFRLPRTMNNVDRWYAVNAYAARYLLRSGVATLIAAPVVALVPGMVAEVYALAMVAFLLIGPFLSLVLGLRYLRTLP
jgi:hypothetical protein